MKTLLTRLRLRWGIAAMLTTSMAALIITLVGVTTALEIQRRQAASYQALERRSQLLAATLQETLADPLYFFDVDGLEDVADLLLEVYESENIRVYDSQGRVLAGSFGEEPGQGQKFQDPFIVGAMSSGQTQSRWGFERLQVAGPVVVGREVIGGYAFELDTRGVKAEIRAMTLRRIWEGLALALAGAAVAFAVAQYMARPIRRLSQATQRISGGNFEFNVESRRRDEVGALTRSFTQMVRRLQDSHSGLEWQAFELMEANELLEAEMAERERVEAQFLQAQKMESVGRLAGGVAHDFNNLLTPIMGYAQLGAAQVPQDHPLQKSLEQIEKAAQRAANLTRQLLAFSRRQAIEPKVVNLNDLVGDMEKILQRLIGENIQLTTSGAPDVGLVKADPGQVEQVLLNLVVNARDAMPQGGSIAVGTANAILDQAQAWRHPGAAPGQYVVLSISDTGSGMTDAVKAHLFEPFFTTKEVGKGTGLGLSTCYGIVQQHGGFIDVQSAVGAGTTFQIFLPRVEEAQATQQSRGQGQISPAGHETVLLVEDEAAVRELAARVLEQQGYTVLAAAHGEEALAVAQQQAGRPIHLLLTDVIMPHMGGLELARRFAGLYPDVAVLFTSGYTEQPVGQEGTSTGAAEFLQKPFLPVDLARKVREVLDRQAPAGQ